MTPEQHLADVRNRLEYIQIKATRGTAGAEAEGALDSLSAAERELATLRIKFNQMISQSAALDGGLRGVISTAADLLEQAVSLATYLPDEVEKAVSETPINAVIDKLRSALSE